MASRELLEDLEIIFPPGEIVDRYTITVIKVRKFKEQEKSSSGFTLVQLSRLIKWINYFRRKAGSLKFDPLLSELLELNLKQWDMEDEVRESSNEGREREQAAYKARINNNERVRVKNAINQLFGKGQEEKMYKGEK